MTNNNIRVRSRHLDAAEVSWFAPICNGDTDFLGEMPNHYKSSWENASKILLTADKLGYRNILCPSSYQVGQDTLTFASAVAPLTQQINLLTAIRCGEVHPPMLGRAIATLDHILKGRLTINIISSNLPGTNLSSAARYQRSREVIEILKQGWTQDYIDFKGEFYDLKLDTTAPLKTYQQNGGPLLYFGGYSPPGVDLCAEHCDVYLMWPETQELLAQRMKTVHERAAHHGRVIDYGLRVHMVVRETEAEAREYAESLVSKLEDEKGEEIRQRSQDVTGLGVALQNKAREGVAAVLQADPCGWETAARAIGTAGRSCCGSPNCSARRSRTARRRRRVVERSTPVRQRCCPSSAAARKEPASRPIRSASRRRPPPCPT